MAVQIHPASTPFLSVTGTKAKDGALGKICKMRYDGHLASKCFFWLSTRFDLAGWVPLCVHSCCRDPVLGQRKGPSPSLPLERSFVRAQSDCLKSCLYPLTHYSS